MISSGATFYSREAPRGSIHSLKEGREDRNENIPSIQDLLEKCFHLVILIARLFSWNAYSRNDKVQEKSIPTERFLFEYELYSEKIKRVIHLGVSHKVTPLKISLLNATGCISRYIDIHQIVYNAKEPINNLQYHNQEML